MENHPEDFFAGKSILITGGLGFLGSAIAREFLRLGSDVAIIDSLVPHQGGRLENIAGLEDRLTVEVGDVREPQRLEPLLQGRDVLINLAGQTNHLDSMRDPFTDLELNCESQLAILETCRRHNPTCKVVFTSTRQIYGRPHYLPVDEHHPIAPIDINGIHKSAGEWYHRVYADVYGISVSILRLTNTYGPRMRVADARQTFLGHWIRLLLEGKELLVFGDGRQLRDFSYVDDTVRAVLLIAADGATTGGIYNLGGECSVTLLELAELMIDINGSGSCRLIPFPADQKSIDIGDYYADCTKIGLELGWRPEVPLREGLRRTFDFFRQQGAGYVDAAA